MKNDILITTIDISDEIKTDTNKIIKSLNNIGVNTSLISGDKESKCADVSNEMSFQSIYSQKLPHEKA